MPQTSRHKDKAIVMAAISSRGSLVFTIQRKYFSGSDTVEFLKKLQHKHGPDIAVFMDNCRIHHSKVVKAHCAQTNLVTIFNTPYQPRNNGIERLWGECKRKFRH